MSEWLLTQEAPVRLLAFVGLFAVIALAEALLPRRVRAHTRAQRWTNNLALLAVDAVVLRLLFPAAAVGAAVVAAERGWGLFNLVSAPGWLAVGLSILLLDLAIYFQHRLFHAVPWLWRLHRVHHADLDFDLTTGLRFHPLEIVLSMLIKLALVTLLGAPVLAVLLFELLLNGMAMFNHANLRLPARVDALLRRLVVTPDMHRVHHSAVREETNSNFGFSLSCWDYAFGSYRAQPRAGHEGMIIGLEYFREPRELRLDRLLLQPLRKAIPPPVAEQARD